MINLLKLEQDEKDKAQKLHWQLTRIDFYLYDMNDAARAGALAASRPAITALRVGMAFLPLNRAALARAVIGGLLVGTLTTLFVVPYVYATIHALKARIQGRGEGASGGESHKAINAEGQHA